ncbi:hypothetical protein FBZ99_101858 [Rhizobium sp. ERR 1071]|uniref:hypothetical protein n=1 Tax=Rhizobium sp. ERR 1071 TaxID=2572677 RepID=UPI00119A9B95|nr:hypothetical protein [Rhizobium sp. ERR1071]TWB20067.1 hypothetical protein FBZ99_101858 [Rhizobium sp. ERR1071]
MRDVRRSDIEKLYRAVADGEPRREILQMMHDLFGRDYELRPPVDEMRLADRCQPERRAHG